MRGFLTVPRRKNGNVKLVCAARKLGTRAVTVERGSWSKVWLHYTKKDNQLVEMSLQR